MHSCDSKKTCPSLYSHFVPKCLAIRNRSEEKFSSAYRPKGTHCYELWKHSLDR